ncbi:MAG: PKD domain-containing protein, partial [Bacteroidota bacterium]
MKKLYQFRIVATVAALVFGLSSLMATHIVGGEIGYECLGNDEYEIILSVYRDCINAGPDTEFDDPASVGIFLNSTGQLFGTLEMFFMRDDTLQEFLLDDCLVVQQPVCVHTSTYREVVNLPFVEGGYQLVYQRCCRNETISNIVDPKQTGATYNVRLTERALQACNTSPQFREWPPIFVCAGEFISYDHSAFDADGDSLVYKLCVPNSGATEEMPKPQQPSPPPYNRVEWVGPTYTLENVLGAGRPLSIDPNNGRILARPELIGQFVVGICVEEYRDGRLLSETRRDFQYNVVPCTVVEADPVTIGDFQCEDLTVNFSNGSIDADDFLWTFDVFGDSLQTSTEFSPSHTYPDTGTYRVQLIAEPNSTCADTAFLNVTLVPNSVSADINIETFDCSDTTVATFIDTSTDTISFINLWQWNIEVGDQVFTSSEETATFILPRDSTGTVELTVRSNLGCLDTITQTFQTGMSDPLAILPDTLFICAGDTVQLNPNVFESSFFNYRWRGGALSSPNVANPLASPRNTTTYTARIFPPNSICQVEGEVTVVVMDGPRIFTVETLPDCSDPLGVRFLALTQDADSLRWNFGDTTNNIGFVP